MRNDIFFGVLLIQEIILKYKMDRVVYDSTTMKMGQYDVVWAVSKCFLFQVILLFLLILTNIFRCY